MSWYTSFWSTRIFASVAGPVWRISSWCHFVTVPCCVCYLAVTLSMIVAFSATLFFLCVHHICRCISFRCFVLPWLDFELVVTLCSRLRVEFYRLRHTVSCSLYRSPSHVLRCFGSFYSFIVFLLGWRYHSVFDVYRSLVLLAGIWLMLVSYGCAFIGARFYPSLPLTLVVYLLGFGLYAGFLGRC